MGTFTGKVRRTTKKPTQCLGCPLYDARGPVLGDGPPGARIVLVGEAPGPDECNQGKPFVGRAGWTLDVAMKGAGMVRTEVYVTNTVKCMPYEILPPWVKRKPDKNKFRRPTLDEMQFCASRFLDKELTEIKPNVTVALGDVAATYLTRGTLRGGITAWRGKVVDVDQDEHVIPDDDTIPF